MLAFQVVGRFTPLDIDDVADRLREHLVAVDTENSECLRVRFERAGAHPEQETPLQQVVQHRGLRGVQNRVRVRQIETYLKCGRLEYGFLRVKCDACRHEKLVAFSCKRRGFCPSCGARRMAETAAHLVDHVLPEQPIRQWVVPFPYPLRFLFATRPAVLTQVLAIVYRAISTFLTRRAGLRVGTGARTGAVTLIQRFGSALNLEKQSQYPRCASH